MLTPYPTGIPPSISTSDASGSSNHLPYPYPSYTSPSTYPGSANGMFNNTFLQAQYQQPGSSSSGIDYNHFLFKEGIHIIIQYKYTSSSDKIIN